MNLEPIRGVDLLTAHERDATVSWLWEGMLAAGNVTLLTSVWKAGKSSLLALLLAGRREGGRLARPCDRGRRQRRRVRGLVPGTWCHLEELDCAALVSRRNELRWSPIGLSVMPAQNALRNGCQHSATQFQQM